MQGRGAEKEGGCARNLRHMFASNRNEDFDDPKSGEVRRIVWRNRFEKTYEAQDSSHPPTVSYYCFSLPFFV